MIWAGLELMGEVPFTDVIIHSTVLAADGRRMSKSLGTGVDPLEMIDAHGADATRYGLLKISSTQDVRFSPGAIEEGRKLANKLWNVSRLILQNAGGHRAGRRPDGARGALDPGPDRSRRASRSRRPGRASTSRPRRTCSTTSPSTTSATGTPRRSSRGSTTHEPTACATALRRARAPPRAPPPVMPHVTEEIWSHLPGARSAADRVAVAGSRTTSHADAATRSTASRRRRVTFRRSGVQVALDSDDERRVFAAVVRPERQKAPGDVGPEIARLQQGDRACRGDARERALRRQRPCRGRRRRAREARALPARARAPGR